LEQTLDRIIEELKVLKDLNSSEGGLADILNITDVKFDDPGLVSTDEYPYIFVAPQSDEALTGTIGVGWDVRRLTIIIAVVVNASDYFDPSVSEVPGTRQIIQASSKIALHLMTLKQRTLDHTVRNVSVSSIGYVPELRGDAFIRMAVTSLVIDKAYNRSRE
jgi:hypothetical protein